MVHIKLEKLGVNLMSLNNFKKVATIATVFTTIACLVPKSAYGLGNGSGFSSNQIDFNFSLVDVKDVEKDPKTGFFPKAIQNFDISPTSGSSNITNGNLCGQVDVCPFGDVKVTELVENPIGNIPDLMILDDETGKEKAISRNQLQEILDNGIKDLNTRRNFNFPEIKVNENITVLRYDITFPTFPDDPIPSPELIWFVQPKDPSQIDNLINDLSGLSQFKEIVGLFPRDAELGDSTGPGVIGVLMSVPEPTATASLLGIGILGTASLLKRGKAR